MFQAQRRLTTILSNYRIALSDVRTARHLMCDQMMFEVFSEVLGGLSVKAGGRCEAGLHMAPNTFTENEAQ